MTNPSIHDLADLLRDRSRWPVGFEWDYRECTKCALGLAKRFGLIAHYFGPQFDLSEKQTDRVFMMGCFDDAGDLFCDMQDVTPDRVADLIDRLIPRTKNTSIAIFQAMLTPSPVTVDAMNVADHAREIVR